MNKIYATLLIVLLSGCHQYTLEEIEKAKVYCEDHDTQLYIAHNYDKIAWNVGCMVESGAVLPIPKEALND